MSARVVIAAKSLDEKGRCCGRKPIVYKRPPHLFCHRCCADFDMEGRQIGNWAFVRTEGGFHLVFEHMEKAAKESQP